MAVGLVCSGFDQTQQWCTTSKKRLIQGGLTLTGGQAIVQVCTFLRYIIVARVIAPAEFGVASALVATVAFFHLLSDFGCGPYLARSSPQDDQRTLAVSHAINIMRGLFIAGVTVAGAPIAARIFGMPEHTWAFRATAIVPLLRAFANNDVWRLQRDLRFTPNLVCELAPQVGTLLLAAVIVRVIPDFRAMLCILIAGTAMSLVFSHVVAERRYSVLLDQSTLRSMVCFGVPLLVNGVLLFAMWHGDRVVIANGFGETALGVFSAVLLLFSAPTTAIARIVVGLAMPEMARCCRLGVDRNVGLASRFQVFTSACVVAATAMLMLACIAGPMLVTWLFGVQYVATWTSVGLIAAGQSLQILRLTPTALALAIGNTSVPMKASIIRAAAVGAAWLGASGGMSIDGVLAIAVLGEGCATLYSWIVANRRYGMEQPGVLLIVAGGVSAGAVCVHLLLVAIAPSDVVVAICGVLASLAGAALLSVVSRPVRRGVASLYCRVARLRALREARA